MLRRILVPMEPTPAGEARLELAILLAGRQGAALTLLQLLGCPHPAAHDCEGLLAAEAEARRLRDRIESAGIRVDWRCLTSTADVGRIEAKLADLTILGRLDFQAPPDIPPESVVLASGRPILVLPGDGPFGEIGRNVVIAWDGSREASRAVRDALPLMRAARAVTVVSVTDPGGGLDHPPAVPIDYLHDQGIHALFETIVDPDRRIVERLLARCTDLDADLLVMGAYGHSRLREFVLGGTTRGMLRDTTVPLFMSH